MAVVDPRFDLSSGYEGVQRALAQQANLESQNPGPLGAVNAVAAPIAQQQQTQMAQAAKLREDYAKGVLDIAKNSNELSLPEGTNLADVVSGRANPTLKPKKHIVTADDVKRSAASIGYDEAHSHIFDDFIGKALSEKEMADEINKRAQFIKSSEKKNLIPVDLEYTNPDGKTVQIAGWGDKTSGKYFLGDGLPAPDGVRRIIKGGGGINQTKLEKDFRNQIVSIRGDISLKNAETQRDAAITAFNRLKQIDKSGKGINPVDYVDILGQIYKARTGQAPTDQVLKDARQQTAKGGLGKVWTYFTGQQMPATSQDITNSLKDMTLHMGQQADQIHSGYMQTHLIKPSDLDPERAKKIIETGRGLSFAEATKTFETEDDAQSAANSGKIKDGDIVNIAGVDHVYHK